MKGQSLLGGLCAAQQATALRHFLSGGLSMDFHQPQSRSRCVQVDAERRGKAYVLVRSSDRSMGLAARPL